jgi:hypothetical protein
MELPESSYIALFLVFIKVNQIVIRLIVEAFIHVEAVAFFGSLILLRTMIALDALTFHFFIKLLLKPRPREQQLEHVVFCVLIEQLRD